MKPLIKIIFVMAIMLVLSTPSGAVQPEAPAVTTKIDNYAPQDTRTDRPCRCGER